MKTWNDFLAQFGVRTAFNPLFEGEGEGGSGAAAGGEGGEGASGEGEGSGEGNGEGGEVVVKLSSALVKATEKEVILSLVREKGATAMNPLNL